MNKLCDYLLWTIFSFDCQKAAASVRRVSRRFSKILDFKSSRHSLFSTLPCSQSLLILSRKLKASSVIPCPTNVLYSYVLVWRQTIGHCQSLYWRSNENLGTAGKLLAKNVHSVHGDKHSCFLLVHHVNHTLGQSFYGNAYSVFDQDLMIKIFKTKKSLGTVGFDRSLLYASRLNTGSIDVYNTDGILLSKIDLPLESKLYSEVEVTHIAFTSASLVVTLNEKDIFKWDESGQQWNRISVPKGAIDWIGFTASNMLVCSDLTNGIFALCTLSGYPLHSFKTHETLYCSPHLLSDGSLHTMATEAQVYNVYTFM